MHALPWALALSLFAGPVTTLGAEPKVEMVELRGRVVCLTEEMHRLHGAELPTAHEHLWGFRSNAGTFYTVLRGKMSQALMVDPRLRTKELLLKGRVFPQTMILEVLGNLRSVSGNKTFDLYYYCNVCAIKSVSPDPCMCCQEAVELKEVPLNAEGPSE